MLVLNHMKIVEFTSCNLVGDVRAALRNLPFYLNVNYLSLKHDLFILSKQLCTCVYAYKNVTSETASFVFAGHIIRLRNSDIPPTYLS
jgi:hypothetical protein